MEQKIDNTLGAHKKTYRKQQFKTYATRLWYVPISIAWIVKVICLFLMLITGWFLIKRMRKTIDVSNQKLLIQRENYKPIKKRNKMDKKQIEKQIKKEVEEEMFPYFANLNDKGEFISQPVLPELNNVNLPEEKEVDNGKTAL